MSLRVLFVNPLAALGGSERSLLDAMTSLARADASIDVRLLSFADGELARKARELGFAVSVIPLPDVLSRLGESKGEGASALAWGGTALRGALAAPAYAAEFRRVVRQLNPTLLHTNGMKAHLLAALAARHWPLVAHLRDFASDRPISRRLLPLLARPRTLVVTNSVAVETDALRVAPELRTRTVYNGIDLAEFRPGPRDLGHLAELAGLPPPLPETVVVGLVATYAWWKGHRLFLAAAERVIAEARGMPVRFYIVGGPIYGIESSELTEPALRQEITQRKLEGRVGLVPFQTDVASVYRGLDIVVHASIRPEPFGRTIAEAMATGCAVVAARAGGAVEVFTEGRSGLGYAPGAADDLARAVLALLREPELRRSLGEQARTEATQRFDRNRIGSELLSAYRALLEETP